MASNSFDVTVLGGGPGGYVAAIRAAQRGRRVALIEKDRLGGVCLNWGCIPTKALLRSAEQYEFLKSAARHGFQIGEVGVDWANVIQKSREAARKLSGGVEFLMRKHKIRVFPGRGRFLSPNRLEIDGSSGSTEIVTTHTIIATGARPALLPGVVPDGERIITSREAMVLPERPDKLTVIGAGAIGLEFAWFYSAFGTQVTIVEYAPSILPSGDSDICDALARSFKRRGIQIHTSSRVSSVVRGQSRETNAEAVTTEFESGGVTKRVESDIALIAIGVRGNIEDLGLETIGVETHKGFIRVDRDYQSTVSGIYAIGDVNGPPALAHAASSEGLHAVSHLIGEQPEPIDPRNIPACIYCHPQVASVGRTEAEVKESGLTYKVGRVPFSANGKAVAIGDTEGFVKIIAESNTGEILGAHILGPEATELIAEFVLARTSELTVHEIHAAIHAHPTLSEGVLEAASDWAGEATGI
jgi:dihydrolipoamide dehydrogenase